ncbi:guanine nucleotide-binding protein subunit gamma 2-like [Cucurbita pepo subsp. pepo]|uniref:guanine nucleotide-binding protein subunit gamma 2-like n=1 Tax=Cucurbita pepo subsp. pepo TaxID=3664 RepID=UPI000C9D5C78|nr:guanine nucleotide-binding protein subunit gamma 2-like [Cucurbita pepo subsp. pepo]
MDEHHQSPPGGGGEKSAKREEDEEVSSEAEAEAEAKSKSKSAAPCKNSFFGRHRISAAINRLQNEINIIEEELQQLESVGESSTVCKELVSSVESVPDPLLSETIGPPDVNWDQWFRGAHDGRNHRRWI